MRTERKKSEYQNQNCWTYPISSWNFGKWRGSKSPWKKAIAHHIIEKPNQDSTKDNAKTISVHLHWKRKYIDKTTKTILITVQKGRDSNTL